MLASCPVEDNFSRPLSIFPFHLNAAFHVFFFFSGFQSSVIFLSHNLHWPHHHVLKKLLQFQLICSYLAFLFFLPQVFFFFFCKMLRFTSNLHIHLEIVHDYVDNTHPSIMQGMIMSAHCCQVARSTVLSQKWIYCTQMLKLCSVFAYIFGERERESGWYGTCAGACSVRKIQ